MLRTVLLAGVVAAISPMLAFAGDSADREIIGFSPDAGVFAFEEYGIEDGSGFPYSNIYVIKVDDDTWVDGTPIRVRLEEDGASLEAARQEAKNLAQPFLDDHGIEPGYNLLASNPVTELSENPLELKFVTHPHLKDSGQWWFAVLEQKPLPAPSCPEMENEPFQGFSLTLVDPDGARQTLHDDDRIPASRKCPVSYTLSDVISAYPDNGEPALVVIVNMFTLGFEGPSRRFIAVTTRFKG
jgi:predicted secreted protein